MTQNHLNLEVNYNNFSHGISLKIGLYILVPLRRFRGHGGEAD